LKLPTTPSLIYGSDSELAPIYYCPAFPLQTPRATVNGPIRAYGYNDQLADEDWFIGPKINPIRLTMVKRATEVIFLYDTFYYRPFILDFTLGDIADNHSGGANISFVDCHVDWFKRMDKYGYIHVEAAEEGITMDPKHLARFYP
jgi:prepilin-type processing-associated H-X9-DG protein